MTGIFGVRRCQRDLEGALDIVKSASISNCQMASISNCKFASNSVERESRCLQMGERAVGACGFSARPDGSVPREGGPRERG